MHVPLTLLLALLQGPRLGTVHFPNSGAAAAQEPFLHGVAWLHSFEYGAAARAFREAQRLDSSFALAYWGEAMTHNHPVWNEQDAAQGRAVLARAPGAPTARERGYLDAAALLFGDGPKAVRDTLYATAMRDLAAAYPEDAEARAFHALALLGLNQGVRDVAAYMRAAALAEEVFRDNPDHPGAAHYLIHAYDDPVHAPLGLRAARAYSGIAPDAAHAQHMTTHIFLALGLWDDVVRQNQIAAGPDRDRWGPGHYTSWLGYGLLQQGRHHDARRHLEAMRAQLPARNTRGARAYLASMRAHFLVNSERWDDPARGWALDVSGLGSVTRAMDAFAQGYAASRRGDRPLARRHLADLLAIRDAAVPDGPNVAPAQVPAILAAQLEGVLAVADGKVEQGLMLLWNAAGLEDSLPVEFGPPDVVKPAHELLGEVLLGLERPQDAQREFQQALALAPRRAPALVGLVRAARAAGDAAVAAHAAAELREIWREGDRDLPWRAAVAAGPD